MAKTVGLRTEILITLTLLLGAALLLGGIMMLRITEKSLLEERVSQLDSLSRVLAQSLIIKDTKILDGDLLSLLPDNVNCDAWWIYDQNFKLVASSSSGESLSFSVAQRRQIKLFRELQQTVNFPTLLNIFDESKASAHFAVPLADKNRFTGLLELHYSLDDIRSNLLESSQITILYVLLYGVILVAAGYYLLHKNVISPARRLFLATENVSQGNLETRLPVSGPQEISQLAIAYNQMVEALQTSRQETQVHILELESKNTELQKIREELLRSEKLASIGQMGAGLAHEIGNPLAALIGYLELLKSQIVHTESADIVARSLNEAQRIDFLVRELLDFATPSVNSEVLLDPSRVLLETVDLLKNQGIFSDISVNIQSLDELTQVKINHHKLQQVFVNLLLNAVQASDESANICLAAGTLNEQVWLSVQDNGCGISEEELNQLFDPFYTTKPQGRGLGLSICHRIVEDAGGSIDVQSKQGKGSTFTVFLPIKG